MTIIRALIPDRETVRALTLAAWCALALVTAPLAASMVHVDHVAGHGLLASTYGVSVGTDTLYCSLELNTGTGGAGIDAWCQHAS